MTTLAPPPPPQTMAEFPAAEALAAELRSALRGEVRFDEGSRALYATDASNYRQVPIGVVVPRDVEDVIKAVAICRKYQAPILGRGAGTSLAGQCCNVAVVLDYSKFMNKVTELRPDEFYAWTEPGCILDTLRVAAEEHHLTFGPDPATHDRCTLGGMIGNNSCGVHSVMAGRTEDNVEELDILLYDGTRITVGATSEEELEKIIAAGGRKGDIYRRLRDLRDRYADLIRQKFPRIPRRVSGYNLDELLPEYGFNVARALVGTEGTCVTVLGAKLKLVHSPAVRSLLVLGYPDVFSAADHVPEILAHKPVGLEGMDDYLLRFLRKKQAERLGMETRPSTLNATEDPSGLKPITREQEMHATTSDGVPVVRDGAPRKKDAGDILPPGKGWLMVEFGGETREEADAKCRGLMEALSRHANAPAMKLMEDPKEEKMVWEVRKSGLGATAFLPGGTNTWPGWEDAAVQPDRLGEYLREFSELRERYGYESAMYGHFGDGCVHMRINFDMTTQEGIDKFVRFLDEAADLVVKYNGSLSGEHGDGQARAHLLPKMFGPELVEAFREFKSIWDPENRMNPGKIVDPYPPDSNLRLGDGWQPWRGETVFQYQESDGSFGRALLRCVGVGRCRHLEGGTMCPSFMATREEMHSTRGRARLLQEMLTGEVIRDGWNSEAVRESLDLCLACKGCKSDCPVNVDMATYKAEFLHHYYKEHSRPVQSYSMGLIYWWARMAQIAPGLVNLFTQMPGVSNIMKALGGIAQKRPMPKFATLPFRRWYLKGRGTGQQVSTAPLSPAELQQRAAAGTKRVILWADTFNNYFTPETLKAGLKVLESTGFEVAVTRRTLCCGRPLYDHGMLDLARKLLREMLTDLRDEIEAGTLVVGFEPSCVAVFRDELVNLFGDEELARRLKAQTFTLAEFLEKHAPEWQPPDLSGRRAIFHGHCQQKAVMGTAYEEALLKRTGLKLEIPDSGCCGMAGSFGFNRNHFDVSVAIGERVLLPAVREAEEETLILTDGFSCREQVDQLTPRKPTHLAELLADNLPQQP